MDKQAPQEIRVRVLRQDAPGEESYWEQFAIPVRAEYECHQCAPEELLRYQSLKMGERVSPVAWDCSPALKKFVARVQ